MSLEIRRASDADAAAVADVWIASFTDALPTVHRAHDDEDVRGWVRTHLVPRTECWVAVDGDEVVAMMALSPGWIDQLYVAPGRQGSGTGSALVRRAQQRRDEEGWESLQLWTFQVNAAARGFYARRGFREVELTDGSTNEEREPDVRLVWP
ncbi:MAG TPA: GNAT family N-acetyltransferase [Candidatus Nanopelagicales bacterium]|nr:GNAT family N-acetyltransferase [Candidatus Nanopelagicales bacterium]